MGHGKKVIGNEKASHTPSHSSIRIVIEAGILKVSLFCKVSCALSVRLLG